MSYGSAPSGTQVYGAKTLLTGTPPTGSAGGPYSGDVSTAIQLTGTVNPGSDASPTVFWAVQSGGTGTFVNSNTLTPTFTPDTVLTTILKMTISTVDSADVIYTATLTSTVAGASTVILRRRIEGI